MRDQRMFVMPEHIKAYDVDDINESLRTFINKANNSVVATMDELGIFVVMGSVAKKRWVSEIEEFAKKTPWETDATFDRCYRVNIYFDDKIADNMLACIPVGILRSLVFCMEYQQIEGE